MSMNHTVKPGRGRGYVPLAWTVYAVISSLALATALTGCKTGEGDDSTPTPIVVRAPAEDPCRCLVRPTLEAPADVRR